MKTPLFPGKTEGLQLFEQIAILGKPEISYFTKSPAGSKFASFFEELADYKPRDLKEIINASGYYSSSVIKDAADLISKLINWEPDQRLSATEALKHHYFKKEEEI